MASTKMWVGAGRYGAWVPCPDSPIEAVSDGASNETRLLNGGSYVSRTSANRRSYALTWTGQTEELQPVKSLYDGLYGDGPYQFIEPGMMRNVLPPHWAAPALSGNGKWPSIVGGVQPVDTPNTFTTLNNNPFKATFTLPDATSVFTARTPRATIPIPPGATLRLRAWGSVTGTARIMVNLYDATTDALTVMTYVPSSTPPSTSYGGADLLNGVPLFPSDTLYPSEILYPSDGTPYTGPFYSRAEIWIGKSTGVPSTIALGGITAQLNFDNASWYPGQGTNGLQFIGEFSSTTYRAWGVGRRAVSASLVEVGTWIQ